MSYIEIYAKEYVNAKTDGERQKALTQLTKAVKDDDKYQEDYMIGYRERSSLTEYKPYKNPYDSKTEKAKWDGWHQSNQDISALADEQS